MVAETKKKNIKEENELGEENKMEQKNAWREYLVPAVIIIGLTVLFFFPEPETNFFAYLGTVLFFVALVIFFLVWNKRK